MNRRLVLAFAFLLYAPALFANPLIFIVRHAEKGAGDRKDPDLSHPGQRRAEWLAATLKDAGITAVFATEFKRTQQTAEPLARATHLNVTVLPANDTAALVAKVKETQGNALVVGHSNTIPEILKAFGSTMPIAIDENDYTNLFVFSPGSPPALARMRVALESDD
ncbi:MAG: histidine phosphatase family protein [Verrucomicrobiota bacterium]|nr:histidine phosphatase family protein [Verrucomicrobiota bacterium]